MGSGLAFGKFLDTAWTRVGHTSFPKGRVEPVEESRVVVWEQVSVAVERRADRRVSETRLYLLRAPTLADEDGGAAMAQVVKSQAFG